MTIPPEHDRVDFFYIAALPKSASSFVWAMASALQEPDERANAGRLPQKMPDAFAPLHRDLLELFPRGGVYKSHAPFTDQTAELLQRFGCKYAILLRHPADFIAALYCHLVGKHQQMKAAGNMDEWIDIHVRVSRARLDYPNSSIETGIAHLIADGALIEALRWMDAWLTLRDPQRSIVLTYAGIQRDLKELADRLSLLIEGEPTSADCLAYLEAMYASASSRVVSKDKYPRGWTGKLGVWQNYFSSAHIEMFNRIVTEFRDTAKSNSPLFEIFPELSIITV